MKKILPSVFLICIINLAWSLVVYSSDDSQRMDIINKELNCFSGAKTLGAVDWNDICVTSSDNYDQESDAESRDEIIAKTMDQMILEHQQMANDMLEDPDDEKEEEYQKLDEDVNSRQDEYHAPSELKNNDRQQHDERPSVSRSVSDDWWYNVTNAESQAPQTFRTKSHTFDMSAQLVQYQYKEPGVMKLVGLWQGYHAQYFFRPPEGNLLNNSWLNVYSLEGFYASGDHDYHGGGSFNGVHYPLVDKGVPGTMWEGRVLFGKDYYTSDFSRITPYLGLGVREKADKMGGRVTVINNIGFLGYDRTATYFYIPVGVWAELQDNNKFGVDLAFNLEYDHLVKGFTKTHGTDLNEFTLPDYANEDINFHQLKGHGFRASLKILKHFNFIDLYVEPFVRYWNLGQSKAVLADFGGGPDWWVEPENNTFEYGSKFGAKIGW